jgi:hypothetical protein
MWLGERSLIDMAFPMNYKRDLPSFVAGMESWLPLRERVTVVPGLWTAGGAEVARAQVQAAVEATGNFCLFAYSSLYGGRGEASPQEAGARESRRREIVPCIQKLAATQPPSDRARGRGASRADGPGLR